MKKIILLLLILLATSLTLFSQVYNFNSDTIGMSPTDITEVNGTIIVSEHPTQGKSMVAQTASTAYTAVFNMDRFQTASNCSVTWKETYVTAQRNGFTLRANGANSNVSGLKKGYLFQINSLYNNVRIYTSNSSGFTQLANASLNPSGENIPRWYKASAIGNILTLDYSDDGITFVNLISTTDNTFDTGNVQYSIGYDGLGIGETYIDDISYEFDDIPIVVTNIKPFQIFQRDELGESDILVEGNYSGNPLNIEAKWNNSTTWTSLIKDANGLGTFSGLLTNQSQGQGILEVRYSNDFSIFDTVEFVGVGDIFIIAGQSNASGRGFTLNTYSHPTLKAGLFGNDDLWKELADKVDDSTNQVDPISSDGSMPRGTPWPLLATSIMQNQNIPVAFVPTAKGGSTILQWQPSANHSDSNTLYGSMHRRINAVGGEVKGVLFFQGENDASVNNPQSIYENDLNTFINTIASDFNGIKTMIGQIGQANYGNNTGLNNIRLAQINVGNTNINALVGPTTYDIDLSDEGGDTVHFKSDSDMQEFSRRWFFAINKSFYSGNNGYGPIVDANNTIYNVDVNKIIIPFTDLTTPIISPLSTVTNTSFSLVNNTPITINSVIINDNSIEITPSTVLDTNQPITLTYASQNNGVNAAIYDNDNLPAQNFYNLTVDVDTTSSIHDIQNDFLTLPNPINNELIISSNLLIEKLSIKIYNILGELVYSPLSDFNSNYFKFDLSHLNSGYYFIHIETEKNLTIKRVFKK